MGLMSSKEQRAHTILLHQRITVQDVQVGEGNIQNFSDTKLDIQNVSDTTLDVPIDHSEASHDKPKSSFERISKRWKHIMEKFGWV
jgi:hypothetical protein